MSVTPVLHDAAHVVPVYANRVALLHSLWNMWPISSIILSWPRQAIPLEAGFDVDSVYSNLDNLSGKSIPEFRTRPKRWSRWLRKLGVGIECVDDVARSSARDALWFVIV